MTISNEETFAIAQRAIETPVVQEIIKKLATYNLGVCLPHMHDDTGPMLTLPETLVQLEDKLVVSFVPGEQVADATAQELRPVAWRWSREKDVVSVTSYCRNWCSAS